MELVTQANRTVMAAVLAIVVATAACAEQEPPGTDPVVPAGLEDVFRVEAVVEIEEDPADSIAEPGYFVERGDGGFILGDQLVPRVRAYDDSGRLTGVFGRLGDGPGEFEGVSAIAEVSTGHILVLDGVQRRLSYLTGDLAFDTLIGLPGYASNVLAFGSDIVVVMEPQAEGPARLSSSPPRVHRLADFGRGSILWSSYSAPFTAAERPYWPSLARTPLATFGDSIIVMTSLLYPATILNSEGTAVGTLGTPSGSFQSVPVFDRGAFGPNAYQEDFEDGGFDQIDRIDVVAGSHIVMTRGRTRGLARGSRMSHQFLEVYDRSTGVKLHEDVPLPEGSSVMGGGRFLYLLLNKDFPPWRVAKLTVRTS